MVNILKGRTEGVDSVEVDSQDLGCKAPCVRREEVWL